MTLKNFTSPISCFTLANGVGVPCLGFGTWQSPSGSIAAESVRLALEAGYRHIDTAAAYQNEESVGLGIRESGLPRQEIFLTTKLANGDHGYAETLRAFERSLEKLQTDYVDLYLIHWPIPPQHAGNWIESLRATWRAVCEIYHKGKARAIGVSNCFPKHIEQMAIEGTVFPMVNQIEFHPGATQPQTTAWCQSRGMMIQAWSPLAQGRILRLPVLCALAKKYRKTPAQAALRFELELGVNPLPKSVTPERIRQNADLFDFALDDDEIAAIRSLGESCATGYDPDHYRPILELVAERFGTAQ